MHKVSRRNGAPVEPTVIRVQIREATGPSPDLPSGAGSASRVIEGGKDDAHEQPPPRRQLSPYKPQPVSELIP